MDAFLYNWTNPDEVIFNGAKPKFEEVGPFHYQNK